MRPDRSLLIPCLHDEAYAYLGVTRRMFLGVRGSLFFTPEEAAVARRACGAEPPGRVTGGGIDTHLRGDAERFRAASGVRDPYLLYVGRLDRGKNTHVVMAYARERARRRAGAERLVLLGRGPLAIPPGEPAFVAAGVLDEQGKMDACAGALALCQPSVNESFSRVIMESWLNEVPVLVHAGCAVTVGHCRRSGGGSGSATSSSSRRPRTCSRATRSCAGASARRGGATSSRSARGTRSARASSGRSPS